MKKTYLVPSIKVFYVASCNILTSSGTEKERYNYLCPHLPETRCSEYNYSMRHKHGVFSKVSNIPWHFRISVKGKDECPRKNDCKRYQMYLELTNERQH